MLLVLYLFVSQWIRITVLVSLMLIWLNVLTIAGPAMSLLPNRTATPQVLLNQTPTASQPPCRTDSISLRRRPALILPPS